MQKLLELAERQQGAFSRAQALELGISKSHMQWRVARGEWVRELPCVFRTRWAPPTTLQRIWCAALWAGPEALVSHRSAAWVWGIGDEPAVIEVSAACRLVAPRDWVKAHQMALSPRIRREHEGIPVTSPARTLVDLAAALEPAALEGVVERALSRKIVTLGEVERLLVEMPPRGRAGTGRIGRLLERMVPDEHAQRDLERRALRLFREARLPRPRCQHAVVDNGYCVAVVDFAWPEERVLVASRLGVAEGDKLTALGWQVVRMSWTDLTDHAAAFARSLTMLLGNRGAQPRPGDPSMRAVARTAIAALIGERR